MSQREEQMAFAILPMEDGSVPLVVIGIPAAAWARIRDGLTDTFDLTSVGIPVRLMIFGAETHEAAIGALEAAAKAKGVPVLDERRRDFSIKDGTGKK